MHRPSLAVFAIASVALTIALGCGGGGGPSPENPGENPGGGGRSQAVLMLVATADGSPTGASQDLSNLVEGQSVLVRALNVERNGVGSYLEVTNLRVTSPNGVARVNPEFGTITAGTSANSSYTVRANVNGQTLSATLRVLPAANYVRVNGLVRTPGGSPVAGAKTSFYATGDSSALATVTSGPSGAYTAFVPTDTTRISHDVTAVRSLSSVYVYYNTYAFGANYYDAALGCPAPLPTLSPNLTLSDAVFFTSDRSSGVPPPPTGCGGN